MESKYIATTSTGHKVFESLMTRTINQYAARYKVDTICFLLESPEGTSEYVLFTDNKPIYTNTSAEAVIAEIEMMHLSEVHS